MTSKAGHIRATPLYGGSSDTGVCILLELGGSRILLDCGASAPLEFEYLHKLSQDLVAAGGVDAVLLSHADFHHVGALPIILGRNGLQNTPVICTLPVSKFAPVLLYDYLLNQKMEGESNIVKYDYDDIDHAFLHVKTVKYSQNINLPERKNHDELNTGPKRQPISICALSSGRTIGGSIWRIRCGPAEVLYAMDINLRKEILLDGASLDQLPTSPALMITDGACVSRNPARRKKEKDEIQSMLSVIMETVRSGGNVLIPCETAGRLLELLQILGKYWADNKLGIYHLMFLSHMAKNIPEFSRCQLEWASDSLTRGFYNGKPNPFDLPYVKYLTNIRSLEKDYHGPKVVLATDASLSYGLAKELLCKWGGDPRCKILFVDQSDPGSLAYELRQLAHHPPIITTIHIPARVDLTGQELAAYKVKQDNFLQQQEQERLQKKRQLEFLSQINANQDDFVDDEDLLIEDETSPSSSSNANSNSNSNVMSPPNTAMSYTTNSSNNSNTNGNNGNGGLTIASGLSFDPNTNTNTNTEPQRKRKRLDSFLHIQSLLQRHTIPTTTVSLSLSSSSLPPATQNNNNNNNNNDWNIFAQPSLFPRFEYNEPIYEFCEYGMMNNDLTFVDIQSADTRMMMKDGKNMITTAAITPATTTTTPSLTLQDPNKPIKEDAIILATATTVATTIIPYKYVSTPQRIQFTCEFKSFNLSGRTDYKTMKMLLSRISPLRVLVVRGLPQDCQSLVTYLREGSSGGGSGRLNIQAFAPANRRSIGFPVYTERLQLQIPRNLIPVDVKQVKLIGSNNSNANATGGGTAEGGPMSGAGGSSGTVATVCLLAGSVISASSSSSSSSISANGLHGQESARLLKFLGPQIRAHTPSDEYDSDLEEDNGPLRIVDPTVGVISMGEITLNNLKQYLETSMGIPTEFRIGVTGGVLVCDSQIFIRKDGNQFSMEGPPINRFYEVRKALYQQFAFI